MKGIHSAGRQAELTAIWHIFSAGLDYGADATLVRALEREWSYASTEGVSLRHARYLVRLILLQIGNRIEKAGDL